MKINSSLEWNAVEIILRRRASKLVHEQQIKQMIRNISKQVSKLSSAEVEARQGKKHKAEELLKTINDDLELVEEYILIAKLINL